MSAEIESDRQEFCPAKEGDISTTRHNNGLLIASFVWIVCLLAALGGAAARQSDLSELWPFAAIAAVPAVTSLVLWPFIRREWAQIMVILAWLALAIFACLAIAFVPMAILFLCAPAAAMLFEREKVIEAMVLAAIFAAALFYAGQSGFLPSDIVVSDMQSDWGKKAGIASTIAFLIAAMYTGAATRNNIVSEPVSGTAKPVDVSDYTGVPGGLMKVDKFNRVTDLTGNSLDIIHGGNQSDSNYLSNILSSYDNKADINELIDTVRRERGTVRRTLKQSFDSGVQHLEFTATSRGKENVILHIDDRSVDYHRLSEFESARAEAEQETENKSLFFAGVSHELRTPLNAIIGFSDMMRSRLFGPLPNKYAEYAELIHDSGQHMLDLIGDVLDLSKVEAGKYDLVYTSFDAADVIRSTIKMIRPSADAADVQIEVELEPADADLILEADRKAIRQMLLNLLSNAIKFTPKGGKVRVKGHQAGDNLNITVRDNGVGMSAEALERVGQPYMQSQSGHDTDARGTGLGLSLVKSLVDLHGGRFSLASQEGKGTTAEIFLPRSRRNQND